METASGQKDGAGEGVAWAGGDHAGLPVSGRVGRPVTFDRVVRLRGPTGVASGWANGGGGPGRL